jgi:hypothetical protein
VNGVTEMSTSMQPLNSGTARPSEVFQLPSPSESRLTPSGSEPGTPTRTARTRQPTSQRTS